MNARSLGFSFHVLVLDDDAFEAKLLSDVLRDLRSGITIHTVTSSEQAIAFLYRDAGFASAPKPHLFFWITGCPATVGVFCRCSKVTRIFA